MGEVSMIQHSWEAFGTAILFGAITVTLFCLYDFVKYIKDKYL